MHEGAAATQIVIDQRLPLLHHSALIHPDHRRIVLRKDRGVHAHRELLRGELRLVWLVGSQLLGQVEGGLPVDEAVVELVLHFVVVLLEHRKRRVHAGRGQLLEERK